MRLKMWLQIMSAVVIGLLLAWMISYVAQRIAMTLGMFAVGFVIAYIMDPVIDWLERHRLTRAQGVGVVMLTVGILLFLAFSWVIPPVVTQTKDLIKNYPQYVIGVENALQNAEAWVLRTAGDRLEERQVADIFAQATDKANNWLQQRAPQMLQLLIDALVKSANMLVWLVIVTLISIQFTFAFDIFKCTITRLLPAGSASDVSAMGRRVSAMLSRYVVGQVTMCVLMGSLTAAGLFVLEQIYGTKYSLLLGLIAGVLYIIPWVGAIVTNISAVLIGYLTAAHDPFYAALATLATLTVSNFVCDNILTPRVVGQKIGLHPLIVFFALLGGAQLFGIWGMIIAAPTAASIKIILARWLPLREPEGPVRGPRPLVFDVDRIGMMIAEGYTSVRGRIQDVMGINPDTVEESESDNHEAPLEKEARSDDNTGTP